MNAKIFQLHDIQNHPLPHVIVWNIASKVSGMVYGRIYINLKSTASNMQKYCDYPSFSGYCCYICLIFTSLILAYRSGCSCYRSG